MDNGTFPIVYTFRRLIAGHGFIADVALRGHALQVEQDDGTWIYGVAPGGIAGSPEGEFFESLATILFDIAHEATTFDRFREDVTIFFFETCVPNLEIWKQSGSTTTTSLDVRCVQPSEMAPSMNVPDDWHNAR